jgi:hypothetical protein
MKQIIVDVVVNKARTMGHTNNLGKVMTNPIMSEMTEVCLIHLADKLPKFKSKTSRWKAVDMQLKWIFDKQPMSRIGKTIPGGLKMQSQYRIMLSEKGIEI